MHILNLNDVRYLKKIKSLKSYWWLYQRWENLSHVLTNQTFTNCSKGDFYVNKTHWFRVVSLVLTKYISNALYF